MLTSPSEGETTLIEKTQASIPVHAQPRQVLTSLIFLCVCIAVLMTGFGIIIPVYPQRLQALGLGAETLALMEGGFGLGMFLFSTPMGTLAGRIGRKPVVFLSLAGFILTNLALAFVNISLLFIVIRFIEGSLIAGLMPASMAMVGDSVPVHKQGRWIGMMTTAQGAGFALGPGIGGFFYQAWGFTSPFLITSGMAAIAALLALFLLPETLSEQVRKETQQRQDARRSAERRWNGTVARTMYLTGLFAPLIVIDFGVAFIYPFVLPQYPFFFENVLKYDAAQYGVVISSCGLAVAIFPLFLGRFSETLPQKPLIIVGGLLEASLNAGMLLLHQYALLIVAAMVAGLGNALLQPALGATYLGATTASNRSQVMGIRGSAISLGVLFGPLTQALLAPIITPQMTFTIGILIALAIALIGLFSLNVSTESGRAVR